MGHNQVNHMDQCGPCDVFFKDHFFDVKTIILTSPPQIKKKYLSAPQIPDHVVVLGGNQFIFRSMARVFYSLS